MNNIYIQVVGYGLRGPLYSVRYNGEIVVPSTIVPLCDGARALAALGCSGPLEMWDDVRPYARMKSTVEAASKVTVNEGERLPKFKKWEPFSRDGFF